MFKLENVLQLKSSEEIRFVAKRHVATIIPRLAVALLLIVVPFFFLPFLFREPIGMGVFFVLVFSGLFLAWRTLAMWDGDTFVVSSARIVKVFQAGLFSRTVTETALARLSDVSWSKYGLFGMMFNFGDLSMLPSGQRQKLIISKVANPKAVHALLMEAIERAHADVAVAESARRARLERVRSFVERLDDAALAGLEQSLASGDAAGRGSPSLSAVSVRHAGIPESEITVAHLGDCNHQLKPMADI